MHACVAVYMTGISQKATAKGLGRVAPARRALQNNHYTACQLQQQAEQQSRQRSSGVSLEQHRYITGSCCTQQGLQTSGHTCCCGLWARIDDSTGGSCSSASAAPAAISRASASAHRDRAPQHHDSLHHANIREERKQLAVKIS